MANTFTCLHYHVVFSTKHREPFLRADIQERVWAYLGHHHRIKTFLEEYRALLDRHEIAYNERYLLD
jgi:hypothetical protein